MRRTIISTTVCMALALLLAVSCNKTDETDIYGNERSVINAVAVAVGRDTKTHNAICYEVVWDESDKLFVTDGKNTDNFTISDGAGSTKGLFTQDLDEILNPSKTKISGEVEIFSPSSLKSGDCYVWPASQTADPPVPMYTKDTISGTGEEKVYFSGLGAMLQIALTTSEKNIGLSEIKLYDGNKPMSGEFTVEDGKAVITSTDKSGISLNLDNVTIGNAAKYFNISVPAGKYEELHLEFTFSDGRTRKMVSTTMPEIKRNTVAKIAIYLDISRMPKSISLNYNVLDLVPGDEYSLLKATVLPENAENKNVIWSSSDENIATVDQKGKVTAIALGNCTITATAADSWLTASCALTVKGIPSGALSGKFSVAEDRQVFFSAGNLWQGYYDVKYYKNVKDGFHIEERADDVFPIMNGTWLTNHKCHFYWSKIAELCRMEHYLHNERETTNDVLFTNLTENTPNPDFTVIINGIERKGQWRTLSSEEWDYLLNKRTMTYGKPRYSNLWTFHLDNQPYHGLVIYPDDYNQEELDPLCRSYTWEQFNEAGIVFLVTAGVRDGSSLTGVLNESGRICRYWTSNCNADIQWNACSVYVGDIIGSLQSGVSLDSKTYSGTGCPIRIVKDVLK